MEEARLETLLTGEYDANNALLYFGGMAIGVLISLLLNHTVFRGNPVPFVMELPNYRQETLPTYLSEIWPMLMALKLEILAA